MPKRRRRLGGVDEMLLPLSAKGLTHGEISAHLEEIYGAKVSEETITRITDGVIETMAEWQIRPLDAVYPVVFIDAIMVKFREGEGGRPRWQAVAGLVFGGARPYLAPRFKDDHHAAPRIRATCPLREERLCRDLLREKRWTTIYRHRVRVL